MNGESNPPADAPPADGAMQDMAAKVAEDLAEKETARREAIERFSRQSRAGIGARICETPNTAAQRNQRG